VRFEIVPVLSNGKVARKSNTLTFTPGA